MLKTLVLAGYQGSGKTTTATVLKKWCYENHWQCKIIKFADPLYKMHDQALNVLFDLGVNCIDKDGDLLQMLGDYVRNKYGHDILIRLALETVSVIKKYASQKTLIIIEDARLIEEVMAFGDDAYAVYLFADKRDRELRAKSWRKDSMHKTETGFDHVRDIFKYFDLLENTSNGYTTPNFVVQDIVEKYLIG